MPVALVKAALISSSAFLSEAAAKTVMAFSCACAPDSRLATPSAIREAVTRASILAFLRGVRRGRADAAPQSGLVVRQTHLSGDGQSGSAVPEQKARLRRAMGHAGTLASLHSKAKAAPQPPRGSSKSLHPAHAVCWGA